MTTHYFFRNDGPWNTLCGRLADPKRFFDGHRCKNCQRTKAARGIKEAKE